MRAGPTKTIFVHTDASGPFWVAVVTRCPEMELCNDTNAKQHEILAFISGDFTDTQEHWTTFEKIVRNRAGVPQRFSSFRVHQ